MFALEARKHAEYKGSKGSNILDTVCKSALWGPQKLQNPSEISTFLSKNLKFTK